MFKLLSSLRRSYLLPLFLLVGCAGMQRDCSSCVAENAGADWVIVQVDLSGRPFRCWALRNVGVTNESQSDGIYWEAAGGNLVHISGLYNRVQVVGGRWDAAYRELGLTGAECARIRTGQPAAAPAPAPDAPGSP